MADYGAANAGVIHFTKSAAMELARFGLRVNCIIPGTHDTESSRARAAESDRDPNMQWFRELAAKAPPLGRLGDPLDTGGLAVFLALLIDGSGRLKAFYRTAHFLSVVSTMAAILTIDIVTIVVALTVTFYLQSKKTDFI